MEIFAEKIASADPEQRILALRLLRAIDGELAEKLAVAVSEGETEQSEVRMVANQVAEEAGARARLLPRVYVHIRAEEDRLRARSVGEELKTGGYVVPGVERLVDIGPSSSQLRYFKKAERHEANQVAAFLDSIGVAVNMKYIPGYEVSKSIQPRHYELWFARGEPKR